MKYIYLSVFYKGTKCFHNLIVGPNILKCHIKPIVGKDESAREGEKRVKVVTKTLFSTNDMLKKYHHIHSV